MEFKCPHCHQIITEKDLQENQISATHLKELFIKKEEEYKIEFSKTLLKEKEEEYKNKFYSLKEKVEIEQEKTIAQKELEIEKSKQIEIDQLKSKLNEQEVQLTNNKAEIAKLVSQKELEINNKKQLEIDTLKTQLNEQQIQLKNNASEIEKLISQKELEINNKKQLEIDALNKKIINLEANEKTKQEMFQAEITKKELEIEKSKQIKIDELQNLLNQQDIKIQNTEAEIKALLSEKELELEQKKHAEINEIKKILQEQEVQFKTYQVNSKAILLEKELEMQNAQELTLQNLTTNHLAEKNKMQEKIRELELANALNRVIQSKAKGENFEHDVEKILRDSFEPEDMIKKITSADKKADYLQVIRNDDEKEIGKIVYEVKNAEWSDAWEKKLIDDMAKENSKYGILIATSLNKKYPGISFKRSDLNPNIYLVDTESFIFIGQLIKSLIKAEHKIEERYQGNSREEKIQEFKTWKETQLPSIDKIIQDNIARIEKAETSITKQVNEIRIARNNVTSEWLYKIKEFIENIII